MCNNVLCDFLGIGKVEYMYVFKNGEAFPCCPKLAVVTLIGQAIESAVVYAAWRVAAKKHQTSLISMVDGEAMWPCPGLTCN